MLSKQKEAVQVFTRVRDFLKAQPPEVGYGSVDGVVKQLEAVIAELEQNARDQDARHRGAKEGTQLKRAQIRALRGEFMRPIAEAARSIFRSDPASLSAFEMPEVRDYVGTIAAGEAMAETASRHVPAFVAHGLPEDFVARMQAAATSLRTQLAARDQEFGRRSASTAALRLAYARGRSLVRMLDAMVAPRLASAPPRLAEWRTLSRFARLAATTTDAVPVPPSVIPPAGPVATPPKPDEARAA